MVLKESGAKAILSIIKGNELSAGDNISIVDHQISAIGVATLDSTGKVPASQLPSYVDDVLEYDSYSSFPTTGESGKIYVDKSTNKTYRWSGTSYVEISQSLALGETSSTAYPGDKGKAVTDSFTTHASDTVVHITAAERSNWNSKPDSTAASSTSAGLMSAADKAKLDSIWLEE